MILATYQPKKNKHFALMDPEVDEFDVTFEKRFGYEPVWCFAANSIQEFIKYSLLVFCACPEELLIFETDNYVEVDFVRAKQFLHICEQSNELALSYFDLAFEISNSKYSMYIVREIPNTLLCSKIDFHSYLYQSVCFESNQALSNYFANLQLDAQNFIKACIQAHNFNYYEEDRLIWQMYIEKMAFEIFISPFIVGTLISNEGLFEAIAFQKGEFFDIYHELLESYNNISSTDVVFAYQSFDKFFSLMDSCFKQVAPWGLMRIGRNAPCPCGSGRKYKKCCMGKYYDV